MIDRGPTRSCRLVWLLTDRATRAGNSHRVSSPQSSAPRPLAGHTALSSDDTPDISTLPSSVPSARQQLISLNPSDTPKSKINAPGEILVPDTIASNFSRPNPEAKFYRHNKAHLLQSLGRHGITTICCIGCPLPWWLVRTPAAALGSKWRCFMVRPRKMEEGSPVTIIGGLVKTCPTAKSQAEMNLGSLIFALTSGGERRQQFRTNPRARSFGQSTRPSYVRSRERGRESKFVEDASTDEGVRAAIIYAYA